MKCQICDQENNERGLSSHLKAKHGISMKEYYDKYIKEENEGVCPVCKKETKFLGPKKGYRKFCSVSCSKLDNDFKQKLEQYYIKKYGVKNPMQAKEVKEKSKKTLMDKYGVENISQLEEIKDKKIKTCLKNNNVKHPQQSLKIRKKREKNFKNNYGVKNPSQLDIVKKKKEKKSLKRYGTKSVLQSNEIRTKIKETLIKKYNVDHPFKSEEIKKKRKKTFLKLYAVDHPSKNNDIKQKKIKTSLNNYGVKNPMQNSIIFKKQQKSAFKYKDYILPSGKVIKTQGYENYALDILLKQYDESDIITDVSLMPKIIYNLDNKTHRYYPDIYIKSVQKFIEVKSKYTYKATKKINLIKKEAVLKSDYLFEFYVFEKDGNRINII